MNINKVKQELALSGKLRDFNWIKKNFLKGRITILGSKELVVFNDFRILVKNVVNIYGENWDFEFTITKTNGGKSIIIDITSVIIRFKELTLVNSRRNSHNIKDLFVRIKLAIKRDRDSHEDPALRKHLGLKLNGLSGMRMTITPIEYQSRYFHSHLSVSFSGQESVNGLWGSFCTGSGEINDYLAEINSTNFNEQLLIQFLLQIETLVSWESLEGGPHKKMRNIMGKTDNQIQQNFNQPAILNKLKTYWKEAKYSPKIEFVLTDSEYKIKQTNNLDEELIWKGGSEDTQRNREMQYFVFEDEEGKHWKITQTNNISSLPNTSHINFIFNKEKIVFKIKAEKEEKVQAKKVLNPNYKKPLINILENEINKKIIRQSTYKRYSN